MGNCTCHLISSIDFLWVYQIFWIEFLKFVSHIDKLLRDSRKGLSEFKFWFDSILRYLTLGNFTSFVSATLSSSIILIIVMLIIVPILFVGIKWTNANECIFTISVSYENQRPRERSPQVSNLVWSLHCISEPSSFSGYSPISVLMAIFISLPQRTVKPGDITFQKEGAKERVLFLYKEHFIPNTLYATASLSSHLPKLTTWSTHRGD